MNKICDRVHPSDILSAYLMLLMLHPGQILLPTLVRKNRGMKMRPNYIYFLFFLLKCLKSIESQF